MSNHENILITHSHMISPELLQAAVTATNKLAGNHCGGVNIRTARDARYRSDCINITPVAGDPLVYISIILCQPLLIETSANHKHIRFSFNQYSEQDFIAEVEKLIA